ncbi:OmpA family protein [uncultured Flavobacterium sp.]|uniref:OmpA family protein n=1 Tax=uncultured Flavobacterium sp. TaxID=165435 RepID=UPI0025D9784F|nr:OmpA family protein [uncultured Flavobacterium sp.]
MKKTLILIAIVALGSKAVAQEENLSEKGLFNRWSIEANVGQNKAVRPYSDGYYSSDPSNYFNFSGVDHYDLGVRYMFSNLFGLKIDGAYDLIESQSGSGSLPFETKQYRLGLQGVANLGRIMRFETFTSRFNILGHAGIQVSRLEPQTGLNEGVSEDNGGIMLGLTPQLRITDWLVLTGDFTVISNVRQHLNWDGNYSAEDNNLSGMMYNTSLGLTVYLGKKEKHADWYIPNANKPDEETQKRLDNLEKSIQDTDRDGVIDAFDLQNNTPNGVAVDSKGRFIDVNKNGIPDELEPSKDGKDGTTSAIVSKEDAIKLLIEKGYVNVFYDVNQDQPNSGSTNNVYYIIKFLRNYPDAKITLKGFADVRGNEKSNKDLSQRRAEKLYDIVRASGIDASRIKISGEGVDKDYPTDTKIGLDLARRVSIFLE